jgi:protocatechuate 3,4-dioxygenase, beta subunit
MTPAETEGPFYPVLAQKDMDFDLTRIDGREERAEGEVIEIRGRVLDSDGRPIEGATVDLWQANAAGKYNHPKDSSTKALDPNFQGWAIVPSGKDGGFRFKTVKPGAYPAAKDWDRPPHIHFKVTKFGFQPLTTQMYFPNHPLNAKDILLQRKNAEEQAMMIAKPSEDEDGVFIYDIILAGAREGKAKQAE